MKKTILKSLFAISALTLVVLGSSFAQSTDASASAEQIFEADYVKYQDVLYKDAAGNTIPVKVCANQEESAFLLQFNYYGLNANLHAVKISNGQYTVTDGDFFQTDGQKVIKKALSLDNWTAIY
jgi:hypothetical protein